MRTVIKSALLPVVFLVAVAFAATGAEQDDRKDLKMKTEFKTGYAPVNGLKIYYETHGVADGRNPPLVLLHGGGDTIETSFGHVLPVLARSRQVIAFEQQGYGHTADIGDRPFSFEQSADDTAALLEYLHVDRADIFGFSNGGTIALQVAIRHPRVVRKVIAVSAFFSRDGGYPWFWEAMKNARLENMPTELQEAYRKVAPHPENLRMFHDKAAQRMRDFKDIPADAIRAIAAPALVMIGDADIVRPEHAVELTRLLPHAELAVLPSTDHMAIMTRTDWLMTMAETFLNAPMPQSNGLKKEGRASKDASAESLRNAVEHFIEAADRSDAAQVATMYAPDFVNVRITDEGDVVRLDRNQLLSILGRAGGQNIQTKSTTIQHVEVVGDKGLVLLTRIKDLGNGWEPMFYSLVWKQEGEKWLLQREFVHQRSLPKSRKEQKQ